MPIPSAGTEKETFWAVRELSKLWPVLRPLVVVFDDIHWGEPAFLDLIEHVADWSRDVPILLLCMARPELLEARPGGRAASSTPPPCCSSP